MTTTINASTSSGLVNTADTSGVLALQTANTTALSISASQVVTLTNALAEASGGTGTTTGYYGFKNRIINGAMVISQRQGTSSFTPATGDYLLDRWNYQSSQASKFTVQQNAGSVTPPVGFSNYMGFTVASAVSVSTSEFFYIRQPIEGFNFSDMAWGTANAKTVTLSFQVYSSLTGTFGGSILNSATSRSYPFSYSISSANTWTTISVTIAGDTSGTWIGATNGVGAYVYFSLGMGSTYSGTAGAWASALYASATGAVSVVGTSGATFYITGVQLEKGSTATSFDYLDYGRSLIQCQRYYQLADGFNGIGASNGTTMYSTMQFRTEMRASPSVSANANLQVTYPGVNDYTQSSPSVTIIAGRLSAMAIQVNVNNFTGVTSLSPLSHNVGVNSASITLSAEL
jgi:hypothetical protein